MTWGRPLVLALLVLVAGALLGAAAFAAEQHAFVWKPDVRATSDGGWRVAGAQGLRPVAPALAGDHLVWGQGLYTCVLELASGETHVIGAASRGYSIWPPAAGARYVAWIETPKGTGEGVLWVYDALRGRRQRFAVGREAATTAVSGDVVAWYDVAADGAPRVETLDMTTGARGVLAEGEDIQYPVLGCEGAVGWLTGAGNGGAPSVVIRDLSAQTDTTVSLAAEGSGLSVGNLQLARRTLLWTLTSADSTQVVTFDLDTRTTSVVAQGRVSEPATDGGVLVWATGDDAGSCIVRGRPLRGGAESEVGRPATWPASMAVGSGWVAWTLDEGAWTYLEAEKLRR